MKLSVEIIRDRMFERFKKAIKQFYKKRQESYFEEFNSKLLDGTIDAKAENYKEICSEEAEKFLATGPTAALKFIKEFVNKESDRILDAVSEGEIDKREGEICFEVLKHILIAGEVEADPKAKLK
jgi:hypothetical protein